MTISVFTPTRVRDDVFYLLPNITLAISRRISFSIVFTFRWGDIATGFSLLFEK